MKKYNYLLVSAIVLTTILPSAVRAENVDDSVDTQIQIKSEKRGPVLPILREQLRVKKEGMQDNIQDNEELRNNKLINSRISSSTRIEIKDFRGDIRAISSTTRMERKDIRDERREDADDVRKEGRERMKNASSSDDRREMRKEMRRDIFDIRKQAFIKQLNVSLNNLKQVRERISSRIEKAVTNGKDMTEAKRLLVIADSKIAAVEIAINGIVAFEPNSQLASANDATSSTTATSTIDLTKPREIGEKAIKAIKEAHKALVDVVRAIAHSLGRDRTATTTPPVTATTTDTTATTTATTTTTI